MCGGIFGFLGYDMVRLMEKISNRGLKDELNIPDSIFIRPQIILVFDNLFDCVLICAPTFSKQSYEDVEARISLAEKILMQPYVSSSKTVTADFNFVSNYSEKEYKILEIFLNFNKKNKHKMVSIPVFDLKENEII